MRLWNFMLLPYLPKSQLLAQKRECDLILRDMWNGKPTNHILINYIYEYSDISFTIYYSKLYAEFKKRGFAFNDKHHRVNYIYAEDDKLTCFNRHHNTEYLLCNFMNLLEKYRRGQKDFDKEKFARLYDYINGFFDLKSLGIEKEMKGEQL